MSINVCNDRSMASITSLPSGVSGSSLVLISEQTASSSSTIDFTSGIDSTYKEYVFKFINIHPATDNVTFGFQANASGGSGFNETMTTTNFRAYNFESNSGDVNYIAGNDQAQGTGFQIICGDLGNANDENITGILHLFDPASTTFVKNFLSRFQGNAQSDYSLDMYTAGYFNTTSAIDEIQFKMSSGNIDAGTFKLYGVV